MPTNTNRVRRRRRRKLSSQPVVVTKTKKTNGLFFAGCVFLAALLGSGVFLHNLNNNVKANTSMVRDYQSYAPPYPVTQHEAYESYEPYEQYQVSSNEYNARFEDIEGQLDRVRQDTLALEDSTRKLGKKMAVLGTVTNENAVILKYGFPRSHVMTLERDWTLNNMPQHLRLEQKDREFLQSWSN